MNVVGWECPNAGITQYVPPPIADGNGGGTASAPSNTPARCTIDAPTRAQRIVNGDVIRDATATLYVPMGRVVRPAPGGVYTVTHDQTNAESEYRVIHVVDRAHGSQSHYEVFAKDA